MTAYIGYENAMVGATVNSVDETSDNPFANALNWNLYDTWKAGISTVITVDVTLDAARTVDYFAVYGPNIDGASINLQRFNGSTWSTIAFHVATSNDAIFVHLETATSAYSRWRFRIYPSDANAEIACLTFGTALQLNPLRTPFAPPPKAQNVEIINNMSVENIPLGRITRKTPFPMRIDQTIVPESWVSLYSEELINHINTSPFFFTWDRAKYDACICWTDEPVNPPVYRNYGYQDFTIKAWGLR